jgi:hypothetical protein
MKTWRFAILSPSEVLAKMAYGSGVKNQGLVTSIDNCPPIADGEGSVVTARFVTREVHVVASMDVIGADGGRSKGLTDLHAVPGTVAVPGT